MGSPTKPGRDLLRPFCARCFLLVLLASWAGPPALTQEPPSQAADRVVVSLNDNGEALENPGMGWVFHYYDNSLDKYGSRLSPSDTVAEFPGATVVYFRLAWSFLEPQEGRYNWSILDAPSQRWIAEGKQIALRISASESNSSIPYATPRWVREAGAKGYHFKPGEGVVEDESANWEPDFEDPVFLEKLDSFLAALAARYDGNPNVAFIDVGSMGVWGEGHTFWSTKRNYSAGTIRTHVDLYKKHFKETLHVGIDDFRDHGRGQAAVDYVREQGLALRDDSILVQAGDRAYLSADAAEGFWRNVPVILESEHYGSSVQRGAWGDGRKYLEAIERYHASYASVHWYPREFYAMNPTLVAEINRRLGYRLQFSRVSWDRSVRAGGSLRLEYTVRNGGVAPCLPGGHVALTLKGRLGGIVGVLVDEDFSMRALPVGENGPAEARTRSREFLLPPSAVLAPGEYDVYLSVGSRIGTPRIELPLGRDDGERRYILGSIVVEEAAPAGSATTQ